MCKKVTGGRGLRLDLDGVAVDDDPVDEEAHVVLRETFVAGREEAAEAGYLASGQLFLLRNLHDRA